MIVRQNYLVTLPTIFLAFSSAPKAVAALSDATKKMATDWALKNITQPL
jgi:hypothetical protein